MPIPSKIEDVYFSRQYKCGFKLSHLRARLNPAYVYLREKDHAVALSRLAEGLALDRTGEYREQLPRKQAKVLDALAQRSQRDTRPLKGIRRTMSPSTVITTYSGSTPDARLPGLASVIVPCCGQREYTRLLVHTLLRHSPAATCEVLFLDICSLDGTADYLAGVADAAPLHVEVLRAGTDPEIPAICREALARARGAYLVLLNNDTLVPPDWLDQLVALAELAPAIGLVGPMSNHAVGPQFVEHVHYHLAPRREGRPGEHRPSVDLAPVEAFARAFREEHRGKWMEVDHLGGFCLLVKRTVLEQLGPLETHTGLEVFDTDALCRKVRQAGYRLALGRDLFVHAFGSRTVPGVAAAP